jgi:hypothetical protein
MSMKNFNKHVGNRYRDLPACSALPQPTPPPCAPNLTCGFYRSLRLLFTDLNCCGISSCIKVTSVVWITGTWRTRQAVYIWGDTVSRSYRVNSSSGILTALIPFPSKTAVLWQFNSPAITKCTYLGLLGTVRFLPDYSHIRVLSTYTFAA